MLSSSVGNRLLLILRLNSTKVNLTWLTWNILTVPHDSLHHPLFLVKRTYLHDPVFIVHVYALIVCRWHRPQSSYYSNTVVPVLRYMFTNSLETQLTVSRLLPEEAGRQLSGYHVTLPLNTERSMVSFLIFRSDMG